MKIILEYDDDSPVAQALKQLSEDAVVQNGNKESKAAPEDLADDAVRQYVAENYKRLILER